MQGENYLPDDQRCRAVIQPRCENGRMEGRRWCKRHFIQLRNLHRRFMAVTKGRPVFENSSLRKKQKASSDTYCRPQKAAAVPHTPKEKRKADTTGVVPESSKKVKFDLSKDSNVEKGVVDDNKEHQQSVQELYPFLYEKVQSLNGMNFLKDPWSWNMIDKSKLEQLEKTCKRQKIAEIELLAELCSEVVCAMELRLG